MATFLIGRVSGQPKPFSSSELGLCVLFPNIFEGLRSPTFSHFYLAHHNGSLQLGQCLVYRGKQQVFCEMRC